MKVWIIDSINDGICEVFDSKEKAKDYLLNTICDRYDRILKDRDFCKEAAIGYLENIVTDIKTAIDELYVEDVAYVYDFELK